MNIEKNTEFILGKIDSLIQGAAPYLEKGAEEVIKYKVIEFRIDYLVTLFAAIICGIASFKLFKMTYEKYGNSGPNDGFIESMVGGLTALISSALTIVSLSHLTRFVLSFTNPEMFAIMQLIGK